MEPSDTASTGNRTITMSDVARSAGVSPMTVSNTFRYPERVQEATRLRVLAVADRLGYVPNMAAGDLAAGRSRVIGCILPSLQNSSFYQYMRGLQGQTAEQGLELVLMLAETAQQELQAVQALIGMRVAGIVLIGNEHLPATVDLLQKAQMPSVETWLLNEPIDRAVGYDVGAAVRSACLRHIAEGRRNIALISNDDPTSRRFRERPPIFRREMRAAGLRDDLIAQVQDPHAFSSGREALDALLAQAPDLDAVICPTDVVAAGILFECGRRGIEVPQQLAVIGWGDYEIAGELDPRLTTIRPNPQDIGAHAIRVLLDRTIAGPNGTVDTGYELVIRDSG